MDQNLTPSRKGKLFCEGHIGLGPSHNPLSPSKHNLICKEESTWFMVMRNPDFVRGRNAAPRRRQEASAVSFRFIRERTSPKVMVAVETSSRMARENRLLLTRSPLNRFLVSALPHGSEVTLFFFGGDEGIKIEKHAIELIDEEAKEHFIESLSFPDEVSESDDVSMAELFDVIFQTMRNRSVTTSADIIIVTTEPYVEATAFAGIKQKISESDSRLHVMLFDEFDMDKPKGALLYDLCQETGGRFTSLHVDIFGDMHKSFADVFKRPNQEILIMQEYLTEEDDVGIEMSFTLDESLTHNLKVYLSFHAAGIESLKYMRTSVQMPSGGYLNFLKMNVLDAWVVYLNKPEAGEYILRTRRKDDYLYPVLMTVTGTPSANKDPITVNLWAETVTSPGVFPAPLKVFCEVRKGWSPVARAQITVTVHHPYGETSNLTLSDDGLGDADITKNDGIYGGYFTKFTAPGYYNVYVIVNGEQNTTDALIGPDGPCCGSFFPAAAAHPTNHFRREAGPFTFYVPPYEVPSDADKYPPSRITDLRITDRIDRLCILQWTAVGDNYNTGYAATYEIKIFRDTAIIQSRFADSGQEVYSEVIDTTPEATYGTPLNHVFQLPTDIKSGLYYVALRAFDSWGNAGEPSNAVPLRVEEFEPETIDCESNNERDCENEECEELPLAEKLLDNNSSKKLIPFNAFLSIMSLILFLV